MKKRQLNLNGVLITVGKLIHVEAGLRSFDRSMPEEINRLVTDRISDLLLTPDTISSANLRSEGTPDHKIAFVGIIMIDTLEANREIASSLTLENIINNNLNAVVKMMSELLAETDKKLSTE